LFWLWTLGAYEIVRTMCQAQSCFSERGLDVRRRSGVETRRVCAVRSRGI
jgi:hypothetical protein